MTFQRSLLQSGEMLVCLRPVAGAPLNTTQHHAGLFCADSPGSFIILSRRKFPSMLKVSVVNQLSDGVPAMINSPKLKRLWFLQAMDGSGTSRWGVPLAPWVGRSAELQNTSSIN